MSQKSGKGKNFQGCVALHILLSIQVGQVQRSIHGSVAIDGVLAGFTQSAQFAPLHTNF